MKNYLHERPWIWIVIGFSMVIAALASMVTIAVENLPREVPVTQKASAYAGH